MCPDYPHDALDRTVPYGVYDVTTKCSLIYVGTSSDTPASAVDAIAAWWQGDGQATWSGDHLLVLALVAGSNGCRVDAWKRTSTGTDLRSVRIDRDGVSLSS
jgi:hypothetical protein